MVHLAASLAISCLVAVVLSSEARITNTSHSQLHGKALRLADGRLRPYIPLNLHLRRVWRSPSRRFSEPIKDPEAGDSPDAGEVYNVGVPLTPNDFMAAMHVAHDEPQIGPDNVDPIEKAQKFEGDILLSALDASVLNKQQTHGQRQENAAVESSALWPGAVIPYVIASSFGQRERAVIAQAVRAFEEHTCIRMVPKTPGDLQGDYVHVVKGDGCSSAVGRQRGPQTLSLGSGCVYKGIVIHEFMHAAGFWHEQSRSDRDSHVRIHFNNILPGLDNNFMKYDSHRVQTLGQPYDIGSIMHYGKYAFAINRNRPTITAIYGDDVTMGQRKDFSRVDVEKLNLLYRCGNTPAPGPGSIIITTTTTTTTTEAPPVPSCSDHNVECEWWAGRGECSRNPNYMHYFCAQSCGRCLDGLCRDYSRYCKGWQNRGECDVNPSYMHAYCRLSCGLCHQNCQDKHESCQFWAEDGECSKNPAYMLVMCKPSCNRC